MISHWPVAAALRLFRPDAAALAKNDRLLIAGIREEAASLSGRGDEVLADRTAALRKRVLGGAAVTSDRILTSAFALVTVAARRVLAIDLYDVQLLSGVRIARGSIAEMQTGEGKTFAALLPACLHALTGEGVHVMTVNAYLAERDFELLAPVYQLLGLSTGLVEAQADPATKRAAYACDITYGAGYEFGFDYLRDQVALLSQRKPQLGETFQSRLAGRAMDKPQSMQRGLVVAIVDEADSVLIDEATTPLILSIGGNEPAANADVYQAALQAASLLETDQHFVLDAGTATLHFTAEGLKQLAADPGTIPRRGLDRPWRVYVEQALRAEWIFRRNVDYVVRDDEVQIVDQYTGRIFADRSWSDGLHQAVQTREGVTITTETKSIARITRQRFFRLYKQLCGMTGTAQGADREIRDVYRLDVRVIAPNRTCQRQTLATRIFADVASKEQAIVAEIARVHRTGQPVLVGTAAIETSERVARLLDDIGVDYQLLNGIQDAEEAQIVSRAGAQGAVTIATNMAGRGTDIKLGSGVHELGGLYVMATEPQESTRIDRQLVGRAARQGDPGACRLFVAAEDSLFEQHAPALAGLLERTAARDGEITAPGDLPDKIRKAQRQVEGTQAQHRRQMFAHDDWLESVLGDLTAPTSRT